MFWSHHFESLRTVSFGRFIEAYHSYLLRTFLFRRLDKSYLTTLIHTTMVDSVIVGDLMTAEVTLQMFSIWLKRYGPFKDTLCKSSVLVLPESGRAVPWFGKSMNRSAATKSLEANLARNEGRPIVPSNLLILRYSSDPSVQFVVTTKPMQMVEHYTINNGPLGYFISTGSKDVPPTDFSPTLLECIQTHIFDKLHTRVFGREVCISRESFQQWEDIFNAAMAELPDDHYADVGALNRAMQSVATSEWSQDDGEIAAVSGHICFEAMFENKEQKFVEENDEQRICDPLVLPSPVISVAADLTGADTSLSDADDSAPSSCAKKVASPTSLLSSNMPAEVKSMSKSSSIFAPKTSEKITIGRYMILQGMQLLEEADALSNTDLMTLREIMAKSTCE